MAQSDFYKKCLYIQLVQVCTGKLPFVFSRRNPSKFLHSSSKRSCSSWTTFSKYNCPSWTGEWAHHCGLPWIEIWKSQYILGQAVDKSTGKKQKLSAEETEELVESARTACAGAGVQCFVYGNQFQLLHRLSQQVQQFQTAVRTGRAKFYKENQATTSILDCIFSTTNSAK